MSIADEIIDLNNNLESAKNAVISKGGTVGDTGLAGLASEILSIPSGGGNEWGSLIYEDSNNIQHQVTIQNEDEYLLLGNTAFTTVTIGGETFTIGDIVRVDLGAHAAYTPDNFLRSCTKLTTITGVENIMFASSYFLFQCTALDCELNFEDLVITQRDFLSQCSSLNSPVSFPRLKSLGQNFMNRCSAFAQSLTLPSSLISTSTSMFNRCDNFVGPLVCNSNSAPTDNNTLSTTSATAPMYTTGITLTGTYANLWKSNLPDRTSSPYRKLILGS